MPARARRTPPLIALLIVVLAAVPLTGCDGNEPEAEAQTLADLVASTNVLSTLSTALDAANLTETLRDPAATYTVFAPRNLAFDAVTVDALLDDPDRLADVLQYHVVEGAVDVSGLVDGRQLTTLQGDTLIVSASPDRIQINGATVLQGARVDNGIAYIISGVLLENRPTAERLGLTRATQTLARALETAGLTETLNDPAATYTLFAPTEDAFAGVDVDALSTAELTALLQYHVLPDVAVAAADITDGQTPSTLEGSAVTLTLQNGGVFVNDAAVTQADAGTSNGVIHEIDGVLTPPSGN